MVIGSAVGSPRLPGQCDLVMTVADSNTGIDWSPLSVNVEVSYHARPLHRRGIGIGPRSASFLACLSRRESGFTI